MKATKTTEVLGDDLPILAWQVKRIMQNCSYQVDTKNEWVQWVTGDVNQTSVKAITQGQAKKIIMAQQGSTPLNQPTANWAVFDDKNPKHRKILSLARTIQWVKPSQKWGEVADLDRLSQFLQSEKSPVKKRLKDMDALEVEKLIKALQGIVKSQYK